MRKALTILGLAAASGALMSSAWAAEATIKGRFNWNRRGNQMHDLTVTLTPKAGVKGEWDAVYKFEWSGKDQVWKGTIKLDAATGKMSGTCQSGGGRRGVRNFTFRGTMKQGRMTDGQTFEVRNGKETPMGKLELTASN